MLILEGLNGGVRHSALMPVLSKSVGLVRRQNTIAAHRTIEVYRLEPVHMAACFTGRGGFCCGLGGRWQQILLPEPGIAA